jgi:anthranilate phosphoribosyltransferase
VSEALKSAIARAVAGESFTAAEVRDVFAAIMRGEASPAQIGGLLIALRLKGETAEEIAGAARAMREAAAPMDVRDPETLVDTCGTGGDGSGTANISTLAAIVAAAAGGRVAKHGNRSVSSKSGSADLLEAAGVRLDIIPEQVTRCVDELGVGFMFAPAHHGAMKHAIGPRKELAMRTFFNILGPMTNPAGVRRLLIGVYDAALRRPVAEVLGRLGAEHVLVVHSEDGLDEISIAAPTGVAEFRDGQIREYRLNPADFELPEQDLDGLEVADADASLALIRAALTGTDSDAAAKARDLIALNAGAAIYVAGLTESIAEGVKRAREVIDSGAAWRKLEQLAELTRTFP